MKRLTSLLILSLSLLIVFGGNLFYNSKIIPIAALSNQNTDVEDNNDKCANYIFEMPRSESDVPYDEEGDKYYVVTHKERKTCYDAEKDAILIPSITFENGKGDERVFNFPQDCEGYKKFNQDVSVNYWADQTMLNDITALSYQCDKHKVMEQEKEAKSIIGSDNDFISKYDFMNMPLDDISYDIFCAGVMGNEGIENCSAKKQAEKKFAGDYYSYMDFALGGDVKQTRLLPRDKNCRLKDGKFRGSIKVVNGVVKCKNGTEDDEEYTGSVNVYSVRFIDENKDGFLDAVLSVGTYDGGSSSNMATHYETYTKTNAIQKRFTYLR